MRLAQFGRMSASSVLIKILVLLALGSVLTAPSAFAKAWSDEPFSVALVDRAGPTSKCGLVTVQAERDSNAGRIQQTGLGWIVLDTVARRLVVVTPAHVVFGGERLFALCGESTFSLAVRSTSTTLDLAVLDIQNPAGISNTLASMGPILILGESQQEMIEEVVAQLPASERMSTNSKESLGSLWAQRGGKVPAEFFLRYFAVDHNQFDFLSLLREQSFDGYFYVDPRRERTLRSVRSLEPDYQSLGLVLPMSPDDTALFGQRTPLSVGNLAIRPGFSGAPLFVMSRPPSSIQEWAQTAFAMGSIPERLLPTYLVGMMTKTELNGIRSVAISLPDMLKVLPKMIREPKPIDYWRILNPTKPFLSYHLVTDGVSIARQTSLEIPRRHADPYVLTEYCLSDYLESSDWDEGRRRPDFFGENLKDLLNPERRVVPRNLVPLSPLRNWPARNSRPERNEFQRKDSKEFLERSRGYLRGGGDYGEGGGGSSSAKNFNTDRSPHADEHDSDRLGVHRSRSICRQAGILLPDGRLLVGLRASRKRTAKDVDELDHLYGLALTLGEKLISEIEHDGVIMNAPKIEPSLVCSKENLGPGLRRQFVTYRPITYALPTSSGPLMYLKIPFADDPSLTGADSNSSSELSCSSDRQTIRLAFEQQPIDGRSSLVDSDFSSRVDSWIIPGISLDLQWSGAGSPRGKIRITSERGTCTFQVNEQNAVQANPWRTYIRDGDLALNVSLGLGRRAVNIDMIGIPDSCWPRSDAKALLLGEVEMYRVPLLSRYGQKIIFPSPHKMPGLQSHAGEGSSR